MKSRDLAEQEIPDRAAVEGWTGREIEQCCELADAMGIPLTQAAEYIVPIAIIDSERVESLRGDANARWQDATRGGIYRRPENRVTASKPTDGERTIDVDSEE